MKMVVSVLSYMGYLQLESFLSFMTNQAEWHLAKKTIETNEERIALWVKVEPGMAYEIPQ